MASDRGSATELEPDELEPAWFACDRLHLSGYALLGEPVAGAALARGRARASRRRAVSIDLSAWSLIDEPFRERVRRCAPETVLRDRARTRRLRRARRRAGWSSAGPTALTWTAWTTPPSRPRSSTRPAPATRFAAGFLVGGVRARPRGGGPLLREARGDAVIRVSEEVREALAGGDRVVALETTLVAHGFPPGEGVEVGLASERAVRAGGAVPATIGVLDGEIVVGLTREELGRFDASARKVGPRDLAAAVVQGAVGATTVGGTLAACRAAGIRFMATGGLGGVHRGWPDPPDVSADLDALARTQALVVSSGVKSLLDVPATAELLETLGVPVLGWRTDELPLFYTAHGGPPVSARVEAAAEAADIAGGCRRAAWK